MKFEWDNPSVEYNENGIIFQVHYRLIGYDEETCADCYGVVTLPEPREKNIIPIEEIDKDTVIKWLESILDVEEFQINISNQIAAFKNPKSFIKTIK